MVRGGVYNIVQCVSFCFSSPKEVRVRGGGREGREGHIGARYGKGGQGRAQGAGQEAEHMGGSQGEKM